MSLRALLEEKGRTGLQFCARDRLQVGILSPDPSVSSVTDRLNRAGDAASPLLQLCIVHLLPASILPVLSYRRII